MNRDINKKLCVKCCGGENGEPLGWVRHTDGASEAHRIGGRYSAMRESRRTKDVFILVACRVTISNDFQPCVKAGQLASVALEAVVLPFRLYHEASREILTSSHLSTFFESEENLHAD